jgi:hypothetical protein
LRGASGSSRSDGVVTGVVARKIHRSLGDQEKNEQETRRSELLTSCQFLLIS